MAPKKTLQFTSRISKTPLVMRGKLNIHLYQISKLWPKTDDMANGV